MSAKRFARSILQVDTDLSVPEMMEAAPGRLLLGDTPRLIDEWQVQPKLWNHIRHEIDAQKKTAGL